MCQGAAGKRRAPQPSERPEVLIPRILNECQHTQTPHLRTIKELVKCRAEHRETFFSVLCNSLRPILLIQEKEPSVERVVKYVSAFSAYRDEEHEEDCNLFVEEFLKYLLVLVDAANKTVRFRASQLIAEVKYSLPNVTNTELFHCTAFHVIGIYSHLGSISVSYLSFMTSFEGRMKLTLRQYWVFYMFLLVSFRREYLSTSSSTHRC